MIMNKSFFYALTLLCFFLLSSCGGKKKHSSYIDVDSEATSEYATEVPYRETNGVKFVHVKVNGVGWDMIFDTGCSGTLLSLSEARYLAERGLLTQDDVLGFTQSQIADGSIVENMVVNLSKVSIIANNGETIDCYNVSATVSSNIGAPLLLGNTVLDEVAYDYTIDNTRKVISFNVK
jgi:predicted aspartyl protease